MQALLSHSLHFSSFTLSNRGDNRLAGSLIREGRSAKQKEPGSMTLPGSSAVNEEVPD
jgi:hypothetical protein